MKKSDSTSAPIPIPFNSYTALLWTLSGLALVAAVLLYSVFRFRAAPDDDWVRTVFSVMEPLIGEAANRRSLTDPGRVARPARGGRRRPPPVSRKQALGRIRHGVGQLLLARGAARFGWSKRGAEPRSMRDGRDLVGYGRHVPHAQWPGQAKIAVDKGMSKGPAKAMAVAQGKRSPALEAAYFRNSLRDVGVNRGGTEQE